MCGIAGILSLTPDARVEAAELRTMAAQLVHRGPDDEGFYVDPQGRCGLAFRRLSIIDLSTGHQPLSNEDGTLWVSFNGEIYNYRELRTDLEARGHHFGTNSDTESIVHACEEFGPGCFEKLTGMFAVALWDEKRGELLLGCDPFGKKPLVYAEFQGRLYFASEAKAILALPGVPRRIDPQSLHRYLVFQYVPAPHAIYEGFAKLEPGCFLRIPAGRPVDVTSTRYFELRPDQPGRFTGSREDAKQRLGTLLRDAVARRLISDVPLGAFLSGGVDSSIVVGLMRRLGVSPLRTYSIGFADPRYDESAAARRVARHFQTEHHERMVTPDIHKLLPQLAWHFDEPFADSSAIPTYYVSRWAREGVTVALTGDGGDEAFAGYDRYRAAALAARFNAVPRVLRRVIRGLASAVPHRRPKSFGNRLYRFAAQLAVNGAQRYLGWINIFPLELLAALYRAEFRERLDFDEPLRWLSQRFEAIDGGDAERANFADVHSYLPFDLLTKVDRASMARSLECRCPLLDPQIMRFAWSLPYEWRLGPRGGKSILKEWAADLLPPEIPRRPKMGFGVPVGDWFRGELQEELRQNLLAPDSLCRRLFDPPRLAAMVESHISGRANYEHPLWALLMLEHWGRQWGAHLP
ncbi:Asparagine synthetase [glutamine-hydrolyzing] 1 [Phycisphaerae bacterium RAS1]|nr:Asparagine synthetase [glutamine-hydrolyzing] 1 [Phycisphaerae bacterium RAS1]